MTEDQIDKLKAYFKAEGLTQENIAAMFGVTQAHIGALLNGKTPFGKGTASSWEEKLGIRAAWLMIGDGEMLKPAGGVTQTGEGNMLKGDVPVRSLPTDNVFALRTDRIVERQQIPVYDMDAVAGLVPLFADSYGQQVVEVIETSLIPKCDGGLRIVGDSMYPLLKSGDVVFYKQIHDIRNNIVWGEMYLISFDIEGEEYIAVKYLQKSELKDHISLVSHNEFHKPMDIHLSRVRALAFIKASLRLNSIK